MPDDDGRLARIETAQQQLLVEVAKAGEQLANLRDDVLDIAAEVGSVPSRAGRGNRDTLRTRVHLLESDRAVANLALQHRAQAWAAWQKLAVTGAALVAAVASVARLLGIGG